MAEEEKSNVNRHNLTSTQLTQKKLEKLFKKIDKPIVIPQARKDKSVKAPKDFVRNVPGKEKKNTYFINESIIESIEFLSIFRFIYNLFFFLYI